MKRSKYVALSLMILGMAFQYPAFAAEVSDVIRDHKAMAASYQEKAAAQEPLITEHRKMKEEYQRKHIGSPKAMPSSKVTEMQRHCDAIAKSAKQLQNELLDFSKWHEMRAAELEGR